MQTAYFHRKVAHIDELKQRPREPYEPAHYVIEKVIELPREQFTVFSQNLLINWHFLQAWRELMYVDAGSVWHCLFIKAEGAEDGILVNAEGYGYACYTAYFAGQGG